MYGKLYNIPLLCLSVNIDRDGNVLYAQKSSNQNQLTVWLCSSEWKSFPFTSTDIDKMYY